MAENSTVSPEKLESGANVPRRRPWLTVLILLLPFAGLLWVSNWFYQRSRLFTGSSVTLGEPSLPWGKLIGEEAARELFGSPTDLGFHQHPLTSYQIGLIGGYSSLRSLSLEEVTDADIRRLSGLDDLESLQLYGSPITDDACGVLAGLPKLRSLTITASDPAHQPAQITDAGIAKLADLVYLERLWLQSSQVTDESLPSLGRLTLLQGLSLSDAQIKGNELQHLADLPNLLSLTLANCPLDANALTNLADAPILQGLELSNSPVTDEMLMSLVPISSLHVVLLNGTQVTREGCLRLLEARPDLIISDATGMQVKPNGEESP
ncbi:MAG: hypothetical protein KDA86_08525 [Planctomycetaceae bacterium]|nr:hypothetical protein [Planctomycetaceae bacterium]